MLEGGLRRGRRRLRPEVPEQHDAHRRGHVGTDVVLDPNQRGGAAQLAHHLGGDLRGAALGVLPEQTTACRPMSIPPLMTTYPLTSGSTTTDSLMMTLPVTVWAPASRGPTANAASARVRASSAAAARSVPRRRVVDICGSPLVETQELPQHNDPSETSNRAPIGDSA